MYTRLLYLGLRRVNRQPARHLCHRCCILLIPLAQTANCHHADAVSRERASIFAVMSLHLIKNTFLPLRVHLRSDISCVRELSTCIIIIRCGFGARILRHRKLWQSATCTAKGPNWFSFPMVNLHALKYANSGFGLVRAGCGELTLTKTACLNFWFRLAAGANCSDKVGYHICRRACLVPNLFSCANISSACDKRINWMHANYLFACLIAHQTGNK